jgi:hypothetical protein
VLNGFQHLKVNLLSLLNNYLSLKLSFLILLLQFTFSFLLIIINIIEILHFSPVISIFAVIVVAPPRPNFARLHYYNLLPPLHLLHLFLQKKGLALC